MPNMSINFLENFIVNHGNKKKSHGNREITHGNRKITHDDTFKFSRKF